MTKLLVSSLGALLASASVVLAQSSALLAPAHPIIGVAATPGSAASAIAVAGTAAGANNFPAAESPNLAIDGNTATKYLNFAEINTGFIVTVPGGVTTVTGIRFTTANDAPERDPLSITIEGTSSSDPTTAAGGATWTRLYTGASGLASDPGRFGAGPTISFANSAAFNTYRVLVTAVRNEASANSMQFSEVQLFGTAAADTNAPTIASKSPAPGMVNELNAITVTFSEIVQGLDAAHLLVNGQPALSVSASGAAYTFTLPSLGYGPAQITWAAEHGITDFGAPPNEFDASAPGATWQYTVTDIVAPTITTLIPAPTEIVMSLTKIEVYFSEVVTNVDAADLRINNVAATSADEVAPGQYVFEFTEPVTGLVQVAWAPGHGIRDLFSNNFAGGSWTYTLNPNADPPNIILNEFMASNDRTLNDEDGDASDWIEIYNAGGNAVNLRNWALTDNTNSLQKWRFPSVTLASNQYLVVFASGKNRTNAAGRLHTNFQLSQGGEYLGLVRPDGASIASDFYPVYPAQRTDVSYGRDPIQQELVGFFTTPTPGARNLPGGAGFAPDVVFSRRGGTYVGSMQLALGLKTPVSNAVIRYVIVSNNVANSARALTNVPTASSPIYSNALTISGAVQVRARAFAPGLLPGSPRTENYIPVNATATSWSSDLPVVVLHNLGGGAFPATLDFNTMVEVIEPAADGRTYLTNRPAVSARAGVNIRGSSTQGFAKSSYAVEFWDEFNDDKDYEVLGLPEESDWVLYAPNQFDTALIHNSFIFELSNDIGRYAPRTRFVEVFVNTGGGAVGTNHYNGVYMLQEKIKRNRNRVSISALAPENSSLPAVTGGYLFKTDRADSDERTLVAASSRIVYQYPALLPNASYPGGTLPAQWLPHEQYLIGFFNSFSNALWGPNWTNPVTGYLPYIDLYSWIDNSLLNTMTLNVDAIRLSAYYYKDRNKPLEQGPIWDFDRAMGTSRGDTRPYNPRNWRGIGGDQGTDFFNAHGNLGNSEAETHDPPYVWIGRMFKDTNFFQAWIDRYQELRAGPFSTNYINALIDRQAAELREAQTRELARWNAGTPGQNGSDTSPRTGVVSANGYSHTFPGTYQGEIDFMKRWMMDRLDFMDTNFLARPVFNTNGGMVQAGAQVAILPHSKAGTTIYYTVDGSDPRAWGGGIAPNARAYSGPITVSNNMRIVARAFNPAHRNLTGVSMPPISVPWSGPNAATFVVQTPALVITELMYHPAATSSDGTNDTENFEYIELRNVGTNTLNLTGFRFTNGISFDFTGSAVTSLAPGEHVLIVKHLAAFNSRYGPRPNIAGAYAGNLDNGGERLVLVGSQLEVILDFTYRDDWYAMTDGNGFALQIVNDAAALDSWGSQASWRISHSEGGSPGTPDPGPRLFQPVLVNEALTHTDVPAVDVIELYNPNPTALDVSGWFLSDDFGEPKKFSLPPGTIIPPGGYVLFDETDFGGSGGFALSSGGEEVFLFSGESGQLTGYFHGFDFGAAQNGVTFGRYVTSTGDEEFVAQSVNTLGSSNALPRVGPMVISEIMYHPPEVYAGTNVVDNAEDEFIELRNITAAPVTLFDPANPANTWRIRNAVEFDFPAATTVPAGAFVLIVKFDPVANPAQLAAFRAKYGVPASVPVFGPYGGKLDNSGESVRLSRPDAPNIDGSVPYILVDRVRYRDTNGWPVAADGAGASLQRIVESAFGNDPTNWAAAAISPGASFLGGESPVITTEPMDLTIIEQMSTNLSVVVSSASPVRYQWQFNGGALPGETNATLAFPQVAAHQSGLYSVAVFNGAGSTISRMATLTVRPLAVISQQPQSIRVNPGSNVTFTVSATGTGPVQYQWRFNGANLPGATGATLLVPNAQLFEHSGYYDAVVTDDIGSRLTDAAALVVLVRPAITNPPIAQTVVQGGTAVFAVVAGPDHPLLPINYRWLRNNQTLESNAPPVLVITNVQAGANFRVAVTNLAGSVASANVALTVLPDADGDGIPDSWETTNGFAPENPADARIDTDGDGMTNLEEYLSGTDPRDPADYLHLEPIVVRSGAEAVLQFLAVSNLSYSIQFKDSFSATGWANLFQVYPATNDRLLRVTNDVSGVPSRFYRVTTPLVP